MRSWKTSRPPLLLRGKQEGRDEIALGVPGLRALQSRPFALSLRPVLRLVAAKQQAWSANKEAVFREKAQASLKARQMPGLDRLRDWISTRNLPKAAVTNAPRLNAEAMLAGIGYDEWFGLDYLVIGDECERPKPDPCPYLTACQRLGVDAQHCLVFEDSPSGATAGVAAGATVIGIRSGQTPEKLLEAGCTFVIENFDDPKLWDHLKTLQPIAVAQ